MSLLQPNATPGRSFISKINLKFSSLSILTSLLSEKDGKTDDDTLIHNAFVRFFDSKGEAYPEWLGVKHAKPTSRETNPKANSYAAPESYLPQYQPVRTSYNSPPPANLFQPHSENNRFSAGSSESEERPYPRRSSSRLQEMYNKSRQQSLPGAGYNVQHNTGRHNLTGNIASQRLRERIMNGSPTPSGGSYDSPPPPGAKATWGR